MAVFCCVSNGKRQRIFRSVRISSVPQDSLSLTMDQALIHVRFALSKLTPHRKFSDYSTDDHAVIADIGRRLPSWHPVRGLTSKSGLVF